MGGGWGGLGVEGGGWAWGRGGGVLELGERTHAPAPAPAPARRARYGVTARIALPRNEVTPPRNWFVWPNGAISHRLVGPFGGARTAHQMVRYCSVWMERRVPAPFGWGVSSCRWPVAIGCASHRSKDERGPAAGISAGRRDGGPAAPRPADGDPATDGRRKKAPEIRQKGERAGARNGEEGSWEG